jgi:hypothetical protein
MVHFFPVLVCYSKKNLAILEQSPNILLKGKCFIFDWTTRQLSWLVVGTSVQAEVGYEVLYLG